MQYLIWAIGITGILITRRKVRARLAHDEGVVVPPIREVIARRRSRPDHGPQLGEQGGQRGRR